MGSAHSACSTAVSARYLEEEIHSMGSGPPEPIIDSIAHDGSISRVNLRPYLKAGYQTEKLVEAFVRTGLKYTGSIPGLERYCNWLIQMKIENLLPCGAAEIKSYLTAMSESDFPAVHHSNEYRKAYSPSYRVIASVYIKKLNISH